MKGSDKAIVLSVLVGVVLVGFYLMVLGPKRDKASALGTLTNAEYLRRYGLAGLEGSTAATGRELAQGQIDSDYYSGMNAGSWLADVYDTSRTRDSAPYNYSETGTETAKTKESGGDVWSKVAGAAAAGLSSAFG